MKDLGEQRIALPHAKTLFNAPQETHVQPKLSRWIIIQLAAVLLRTRNELKVFAKKKASEKRLRIETKRLLRRIEQEGLPRISKEILVAYRQKAVPVLVKLDRVATNLRSYVEKNSIIQAEGSKLTAKDLDTLVEIDEAMDHLTKLRIARSKLDLKKALTVETINKQAEAIQALLNQISKTSKLL